MDERQLRNVALYTGMEELPSTALKWPFPKTLNGRFWRFSSAIIIGGTAAFSKIWLGEYETFKNDVLLLFGHKFILLNVVETGEFILFHEGMFNKRLSGDKSGLDGRG